MKHLKYAELKDVFAGDTVSLPKLSTKGSNVFSKRAVLNVGMLLRDSKVAREVRTQLLNGFEKLTDEQKAEEINREDELLFAIIKAGSDRVKQMVAIGDLNDYHNRHRTELNIRIEEMKPKEEFHDSVAATEGSDSIINVAKSFGIGQQKFFKFLRSTGILFMQDGFNIPKQQYQNQGYFTVTMGYVDNGFASKTTYTTKVTGRGKTYLHKIVQKYGGVAIINKLKLNEIDEYVKEKGGKVKI